MKLAFIDIETTGLTAGYHEIIEIAIIREIDGKIDKYTTRIKPNDISRADNKALEINGYNDVMWIDAPYDHEVVDEIASWLEDCILIGHNVKFDHEFIEDLCWRHKVKLRCHHRMIDTITLCHEHLYFVRSHSLDSLRLFFGISTSGGHRAPKDVADMREIYYKLIRASIFKRCWWWICSKIKKTLS